VVVLVTASKICMLPPPTAHVDWQQPQLLQQNCNYSYSKHASANVTAVPACQQTYQRMI